MKSRDGIPVTLRRQLIKRWLADKHKIAPWIDQSESDCDYSHSFLKEGKQALKLYLSSFVDDGLVQGFSEYHYSTVNPSEIIDKCRDREVRNKYGVPKNQPYYIFDKELILGITGDGGSKIKNVAKGVKGMSIAFLKVFALDDTLMQCRHAGVPVLISALKDTDPRVAEYMREIGKSLKDEGGVSVYSHKLKCFYVLIIVEFAVVIGHGSVNVTWCSWCKW